MIYRDRLYWGYHSFNQIPPPEALVYRFLIENRIMEISEEIKEDLDWLIDWFERNKNIVRFQSLTPLPREQFLNICDRLSKFCFYIKNDYPEYYKRLFSLKNRLSLKSGFVDVSVFGRVSDILLFFDMLTKNNLNSKWIYIHKSFYGQVKEKFIYGFYDSDVFEATNILMQRLKNIRKSIDDNCEDIDGANLVGRLFENSSPKILLCDTTTKTGNNIPKGYVNLFHGWVAAIRNKIAHPNADKAAEIISFQELTLMSMLMTALDNRISPDLLPEEITSNAV